MTTITDLETRISDLRDDFRDRLRADPAVQDALAKIVDLTNKLTSGDFHKEDLTLLEDIQVQVTERVLPRVEQVELDSQISLPSSSVPVCLYCGVGFGLEDVTEPAQWARLRRHVERLHRSDWLALTTKPWSAKP